MQLQTESDHRPTELSEALTVVFVGMGSIDHKEAEPQIVHWKAVKQGVEQTVEYPDEESVAVAVVALDS